MGRLVSIIKENWKDPVWSKVIATGIIAVLGFILTSLYSLVVSLIKSISFKDAFQTIIDFLSQEVLFNLGIFVVLIILYIVLTMNQLTSFVSNIYIKITSSKSEDVKEQKIELPRATDCSTSLFHQRMTSAFPGIRDVTWFDNSKIALYRLEILLREPLRFKSDLRDFESDPIWWIFW